MKGTQVTMTESRPCLSHKVHRACQRQGRFQWEDLELIEYFFHTQEENQHSKIRGNHKLRLFYDEHSTPGVHGRLF